MRGFINPYRFGGGGIDLTYTDNGIYSLSDLGLSGSDAIEFALLGPGGPGKNDGYDGTQLEGGSGGGMVFGRAIPFWGVRSYRLRIADNGCFIEAFSDPNWINVAFAGVGGASRDTSSSWWNLVSSTLRNGGLGGRNDDQEGGPNNWQRPGGGAAGFLSNGQDGPNGAVYTADGKGGGGNNLNGNSNGALAGIGLDRNGMPYGGGGGAEYGGLGIGGRPIARIMARSSKTFPSGA